jgi:hypothetical protein
MSNSVSKLTRLRAGRYENWSSISGKGGDIFPSLTASRPDLRHAQPTIQWVPRFVSLGIKRYQGEADHSPPSRAQSYDWSFTPRKMAKGYVGSSGNILPAAGKGV